MIRLEHPELVKVEHRRRSYTDERRKVDWYVYEYIGTDGERYRKSFETLPDVAPNVPPIGTHAELNAVKIQWLKEQA